ncbi:MULTISPECIES: HAD-IIIA family hydrolase [unclassified Mesorhizobium]|uniref:HAD-IIIA family hydrolase n=2 Tax=Mesorhizobium TaxID=68287 RepID=UPI000FC9A01F|nr:MULTISPECIES: HAD-IIIA family hydrolase [unclassified Mesorhizobium]RVD46437.1 HAD-IIIA family hydrolase [Mesorhizobium sp. M4B.F.Ca.ET.019.03.1.1]TGR15459.1 HAD-IIIA family hydrolase [Mesorhizobium sp. M4B.F.Ca.ET.200.01.1.1]TGS23334.1 HAD-IIIA family hydrolase [Mesorhizobium sp. M4B.F.Ca.ET.190.01.1.1]TGV23774.1 HAD-IIIA family hydrolase [Mesorhizobium sp. M4B.F.Ca.ET.143.01.1.1]TIT44123.1 MAG: HAD-IIIA family hydrolase [Mesorhizobium sp.]
MQAVVLAGGLGTRLRGRIGDLPKSLANIGGTPLLEHQILLAKQHGIERILILVNHAAEQIVEFCTQRGNWGIDVRCVDDGAPRGTAGAVLSVLHLLDDDFLTIYGDTMLDVDLTRFKCFHEKHKAAAATVFTHPNDHPQDSDLIETSEDGVVAAFHPYPHDPGCFYPNKVSAALYYIRRQALYPWRAAATPLDFGKDLFPEMLRAGAEIRSYSSPEYIKDAGTPARLDKACADLASGRIARASLASPQKAVFLDRDGCINVDYGHIDRPERFELIEGAAAAIACFNQAEYRAIVVTNQPVVARGGCSVRDLRMIHNKMETELGRHGAFVDAIYYCPHHPDRGFAGEVEALKVHCECRKPATGLVDQAVEAFNIDRRQSWVIGDSSADVALAKRSGIRSILVETGAGGLDSKYHVMPDYTVPDLFEAAKFILTVHPTLVDTASDLIAHVKPGDVCFVAGLSRSGKSVLSSAIAEVLRGRGIDAQVVALDRWIRSAADRKATVMGRYDMNEIRKVLSRLVGVRSRETLDLPYYEKLSRISHPRSEKISISPETVLVVEGSVALSLSDVVLPGRAHTFFVDIDEELRRYRVTREYSRRGVDREAAARIYSSRQEDETPIVLASRARANHCVRLRAIELIEAVG